MLLLYEAACSPFCTPAAEVHPLRPRQNTNCAPGFLPYRKISDNTCTYRVRPQCQPAQVAQALV